MDDTDSREPVLHKFYHRYLNDEDSAGFIKAVSLRYNFATLKRLAEHGPYLSRRAAALAIGLLAGYEANAVLGKLLHDDDRGVRLLADNGIRQVWRRDGNVEHRQRLAAIVRLNSAQQYEEAIECADALLEQAPWFAEVWNQRAIAFFHLGRHRESANDSHQTLELNPYHFGAVAGMGQCYVELGEMAAALECFRRALKLNPDLEGVRAQIAKLRRALGGK